MTTTEDRGLFLFRVLTCIALGGAAGLFGCFLMYAFLSEEPMQSATFWAAAQAVGGFLAFAVAMLVAYLALQQMIVTQKQLHVMEKELHRGRVGRLQDNKPTVVIERVQDQQGGWAYVLSNVGRGFAVNVFEVNPDLPGWRSFGGIGAGAQRPVPADLAEKLTNPGNKHRFKHILIAEGPRTRTRRWNPTLNLLLTDGWFVHRFTYPEGANDSPRISRRESRMEFEEYVAYAEPLLAKQFDQIPSCGGDRG
jgi:hypothetical protein